MKPSLFIGCDPGKSGAIAFIDTINGCAWSFGLDGTDKDVYDALSDSVRERKVESRCILEKVHSSPQMGVKSAFSFGQSFGKLEMLLTSMKIRFDYVAPSKWQGDMNCRTKGDKNVTKSLAQRLFPELKITHRNADALLLAEYCKQLNQ